MISAKEYLAENSEFIRLMEPDRHLTKSEWERVQQIETDLDEFHDFIMSMEVEK